MEEAEQLSGEERRRFFLDQLSRYWPKGMPEIEKIAQFGAERLSAGPLPPCLVEIELPAWAEGVGVDGKLAVPIHLADEGKVHDWRGIPWGDVACWFLLGFAERKHEHEKGVIDSYSFRLKNWDERMWRHAWVNRIALFLRIWAARDTECDEEGLFGPLPKAEVFLTHDVDAVSKTIPMISKRLAQGAIQTAVSLAKGRFRRARITVGRTWRYCFSKGDYWQFDRICELEEQRDFRSTFFFHARDREGWRSLKKWLIDPAYRIEEPRIVGVIARLNSRGHSVGLHPGVEAWSDEARIRAAHRLLGSATGVELSRIRQHWLRFSWIDTWQAQENAGLTEDATLGFNDRPAFRNGAALKFEPLACSKGRSGFYSWPMLIMDSHLFDYLQLENDAGFEEAVRWFGEVVETRGQISILWHQRVFSGDYRWGELYERVLDWWKEQSDAAVSEVVG